MRSKPHEQTVAYCTATRPIAISVSVRDSASRGVAADSANVQVTRTGACGNPETVSLTALLQRP